MAHRGWERGCAATHTCRATERPGVGGSAQGREEGTVMVTLEAQSRGKGLGAPRRQPLKGEGARGSRALTSPAEDSTCCEKVTCTWTV